MGDNMGSNEIKKIATRDERFSLAFDRFLYVEEKQILGNGILINRNGNVIWDKPWKHSNSCEFYVKKHNLLITNRLSIDRSLLVGSGIACISLDTGKYLWFHWYSRPLDERDAVQRDYIDINIERSIEFVDVKEEYLYTRNFKINVINGNYEYIGRSNCKEGIIISNSNKNLKEVYKHKFHTRRPPIKFYVNSVIVNGETIKKLGYSFGKCNDVINRDSNLYFFATPEKNNHKGIIIFNYCKKNNLVVKEMELPLKGEILGVYDFFNSGIMIQEEIKEKSIDKNLYNLWFIPHEAINL
jgi:hypothetical protein